MTSYLINHSQEKIYFDLNKLFFRMLHEKSKGNTWIFVVLTPPLWLLMGNQ